MRRLLPLCLLLLVPAGLGAAWPDLSQPPTEPTNDGANDVAVVIGIEDYASLPDIPGADENASDWYTWLTKGRGLRAGRVELLRNNQATDGGITDAVDKALRYLRETVDAGEAPGTFWFVFVGHGSPSPDSEVKDALLVGYDASATANGLLQRSVRRDALLARIEAGPQRQTVAVLDACFNGKSSGGETLAPGLQLALSTRETRQTPKGAAVFTASRGNQVAGPLPGLGRPAMSYLMLGALRGWGDRNRDGSVTASEALDYSLDAMRTVVKSRPQEPELWGTSGGATLSRERGPDLTTFVLTGNRGSGGGGAVSVAEAEMAEMMQQAEEAARQQRAAEEAAKRAADELRRMQDERLASLETDARASATRLWAQSKALREIGGEQACTAVATFETAYAAATVSIDGGPTRAVTIAEVADARAWLRSAGCGGSGQPASTSKAGPAPSKLGLSMVWLEPGTFWMGSPEGEPGRSSDEQRHQVTLSQGFWLASTEVTQEQYRSVVGKNPSTADYKGVSLLGDDLPVQTVSWLDAVQFCNALSTSEGLTPAYRVAGEAVSWDRSSTGYRLPTEAEWEYAARAGTSTRWAGTDSEASLCGYGNVADAAAKAQFDDWTTTACSDGHAGLAAVGSYKANAWGLYDMSGNVWEWVWDAYESKYPPDTTSPVVDGTPDSNRVNRGGSWSGPPAYARVADRYGYPPSTRGYILGFRVARSR